jgi:hypothetical protein
VTDRLPLLIVLAGPLRWIVAVAAALVVAYRLRSVRRVPAGWVPGRAAVFALSLALYAVVGLRSYAVAGLTGDEPHYLVIAHSLLADRDLQIENNHRQLDYRGFYPGPLPPDSIQRGQNGEIYPNKAPGLPALLMPAYRVGGAAGAVLAVALIASLAALAIFDVALVFGGPAIAWATWAAIALTVPVIPHAWSIFPDIAAAGIAAWCVRWLTIPLSGSALSWMARGVCLAMLPWLHTRLVVLLAVLTASLLVHLRARIRESVALLAPIALSSAAWFGYFLVIYGTLDPRAPWGGASNPSFSIGNVPRGILGLLFDQKFGLLIYSPIYAAAFAGAVWLARDAHWRVVAGMLVATAAVYTISCTRFYIWWGGTSPPARFLVAVVPLAAPFIATAFVKGKSAVSRAVHWSLLGLSLLFAAVSVAEVDRRLLFSDPHGTSELIRLVQGSVPLTSVLPIFTEQDWPAPVTRLLPWLAAALVSFALLRFSARSQRTSAFCSGAILGVTFLVAASALVGRISPEGRVETVVRSHLALLEAFNPDRNLAFDYARRTRLAAPDWLAAARMTFEREPEAPVDRTGLIGPPMPLPPGRYEATVWFRSRRPHAGSLQVTLGRGETLARADGPLANPGKLEFELPVGVRALWIQLSEPSTAQDVVRTELAPLSIVPVAERPRLDVRAVEAVASRLGGYVVYVGEGAFAERGGNFWTRGLDRATVMVKPAGARQLVLNLSPGPHAQSVQVRAGEDSRRVSLDPAGDASVAFDLAANADWVPVEIQASAAFRPIDVDQQSFDSRLLGCHVQVSLK